MLLIQTTHENHLCDKKMQNSIKDVVKYQIHHQVYFASNFASSENESKKICATSNSLLLEQKIHLGFNSARHIKLKLDEERYERVYLNHEKIYTYHKAKFPLACDALITERDLTWAL